MTAHVIHPIPLVIRGRPMSDSVFRIYGSLGPVSVVGIYVWYIEGPKEKILVDSGMTWEIFQRSGATGHTHVQTIREGLAKYGLEPEDIDIIIQTHLHVDHRANAAEFTRARFVLSCPSSFSKVCNRVKTARLLPGMTPHINRSALRIYLSSFSLCPGSICASSLEYDSLARPPKS